MAEAASSSGSGTSYGLSNAGSDSGFGGYMFNTPELLDSLHWGNLVPANNFQHHPRDVIGPRPDSAYEGEPLQDAFMAGIAYGIEQMLGNSPGRIQDNPSAAPNASYLPISIRSNYNPQDADAVAHPISSYNPRQVSNQESGKPQPRHGRVWERTSVRVLEFKRERIWEL